MSDFYRTGMGRRFYEGTMPALVEQLERMNKNLEAIAAAIRVKAEPKPEDKDDASHA